MSAFSLATPVVSPDPFGDRTLGRLAERARALLPAAAVAIVTVDERRGTVEGSAGWFADPLMREALGRRELVQAILASDRGFLLPRLDDWEAAPTLLAAAVESLGARRARALWRKYRGNSVIACPLRTETGRGLGVLAAASPDPQRPLRAEDLQTIEAVADLAAMALERASRARDELCLERATEAVSSTLELTDVYRRVAEHAAATTGATQAALTRLDARAGELRTVATLDPGPVPALTHAGFGHMARTRRSVLRSESGSPTAGSLMHAPIELGPRLYGVLTVAHEQPGRFDEGDLDLLSRLARSSAAAIANALDFQRERRIARSLTLGFVPESLPGVPNYETGLLYAPALGEPTGGDLYGVWPLPGGEVAALVGDVAGKGVETAALSAMVRFFVEARSWDAGSPAQVLEQTNAMLAGRLPSDTFVTAFLGVLGPHSMRWASAGHLPPLHLSGDDARVLEATGLPLGVDDEARYGERQLDLAEGDLVFAYTDGLVEARRGATVYGSDRLFRLVTDLAAELTPERLPVAVHDEIAAWSGGLVDDAVGLALRRRR
ncbi:MAG: hypothetical protein QOH58_1911 [Thermoleophilaceae bacterium]|jgi:GAF domain-containing protein|nr:hypothetical protein [Thermoleophilaceae bacterium]